MSFNVFNPALLWIGLAGLALPVLAHLLSKKRYDVVEWGAMQFLELGRNARRRIKLEQLLLMLLRMGLIALVALALARPWAQGGFLAHIDTGQTRDVVIIVDGSYSMGWEGRATTPHADAVKWAHRFLEELRPGDTVALLDARDQVRPVIESPTSDFRLVREELNNLPQPSGTSNLADASARGVRILTNASNLARDVIVLTDGQSLGWHADDANLWTRFDVLREEPAVTPRVWVVNVAEQTAGDRTNFTVDRIELSRELTVAKFPVRIKTKVLYTGGKAAVSRRVYLEVDGQRLQNKTLQVALEPNGEASVEFEHRFADVGSHVVSVVLDDDNLPGDNRADAAVSVTNALPVLLVDGDPQLDAARAETFFASRALTAKSNPTPWVNAAVTPIDRFKPADLEAPEVLVLANVRTLTDAQTSAVKDFVRRGGGLFIALGDKADAAWYNETLYTGGQSLLPARLDSIQKDEAEQLQGVHVVDSSLDLPWMARFRREHDGGFTEARYLEWWRLNIAAPVRGPGEKPDDGVAVTAPVMAARFDTADPLLVTRGYGRGRVLLSSAPLDADWSTLPAKPDFVAFVHEMIFYLAAGKTSRNVEVGMPLVLPLPEDAPIDDYAFFDPAGEEHEAKRGGDELRPLARFDDARIAGVYTFAKRGGDGAPTGGEHFVVDYSRVESDLTSLTDDDRAMLETGERLKFVESVDELKQGMYRDANRSEFWHLLMLVFLGVLVFEVVMTRRLVQGGHAVIDDDLLAGNVNANRDEEDDLEFIDDWDDKDVVPVGTGRRRRF